MTVTELNHRLTVRGAKRNCAGWLKNCGLLLFFKDFTSDEHDEVSDDVELEEEIADTNSDAVPDNANAPPSAVAMGDTVDVENNTGEASNFAPQSSQLCSHQDTDSTLLSADVSTRATSALDQHHVRYDVVNLGYKIRLSITVICLSPLVF